MPCRRRSKLENPIWRTTVLMVLSILAMISARSDFLSPDAIEPFLEEGKRRHFPEHRRRFAVGDRGVEHQRALRFAGQDAVHAMPEFVRQRHHVLLRCPDNSAACRTPAFPPGSTCEELNAPCRFSFTTGASMRRSAKKLLTIASASG